jgi:hypothetical protein
MREHSKEKSSGVGTSTKEAGYHSAQYLSKTLIYCIITVYENKFLRNNLNLLLILLRNKK